MLSLGVFMLSLVGGGVWALDFCARSGYEFLISQQTGVDPGRSAPTLEDNDFCDREAEVFFAIHLDERLQRVSAELGTPEEKFYYAGAAENLAPGYFETILLTSFVANYHVFMAYDEVGQFDLIYVNSNSEVCEVIEMGRHSSKPVSANEWRTVFRIPNGKYLAQGVFRNPEGRWLTFWGKFDFVNGELSTHDAVLDGRYIDSLRATLPFAWQKSSSRQGNFIILRNGDDFILQGIRLK